VQRSNVTASRTSPKCEDDKRQWCNRTTSDLKKSRLKAEVVVSTYMDDLLWLKEMDWLKVHVYVHNPEAEITHMAAYVITENSKTEAALTLAYLKATNAVRAYPINFVDIPNIGDEAKAYLTYILDNYNSLPDVVFFVHGHRCSWHAKANMDSTTREITRCLSDGCYNQSYVSLNTYPNECYDLASKDNRRNERVAHVKYYWSSLMSTPLPRRFCMDWSAQFAVSRAAIQAHPQGFYKNLLEAVDDGKTSLEYFWRSIFLQDFVMEEHKEKKQDWLTLFRNFAR
jgi:hypothetical protein